MDKTDRASLVVSLYEVCNAYRKHHYSETSKKFAKPPRRLRCGIARGQVIGIGDGRDYVGACINVATRLQKLGNLSFAFSRRGFDLTDFEETWSETFILVQAPIRGIGDKDPVYVIKREFENLPQEQKALFNV